MTQRFAPGARRLAGVAGALLNWRPDDFWRATPEELLAVLRAMQGAGGDEGAGADGAGIDAADIARMMGAMPDAGQEAGHG